MATTVLTSQHLGSKIVAHFPNTSHLNNNSPHFIGRSFENGYTIDPESARFSSENQLDDKEEVLFDVEKEVQVTDRTKEAQLLQKYLVECGINQDSIMAYEYFLDVQVADLIHRQGINLHDGTHAVFTNIQKILPFTTDDMGQPRPLYPYEARARRLSYSVHILTDLERRDNMTGEVIVTNGQPERIPNLKLCEIPVMIGSVYDNLIVHRKLDEELIKMGECPYSPKGYFIVEGKQRVIMMQEKLRAKRIIVFADARRGDLCKMTVVTLRGSTEVKLRMDKTQSMRLGLGHLFKTKKDGKSQKKTDVCVFQAFLALGSELKHINPPLITHRAIQNYILTFVPVKNQSKVRIHLSPTLIYMAQNFSHSSEEADHQFNYEDLANNFISQVSDPQDIRDGLANALFPQIDLKEADTEEKRQQMLESKLILLALMVARFSQQQIGLIQADDRDNWINKRLMVAGPVMGALFRQLLEGFMTDIESKLKTSRKNRSLEAIKKAIPVTQITNQLFRSFVSSKWGASSRSEKQNVTDELVESEGALSAYDQLLRINTPTNRQAGQAAARSVQESQNGYIDATSTPSGENCGLVKNRSLGCRISVESDPLFAQEYIEPHLRRNKEEGFTDLCLLNSIPLGWCQAPELRQIMIKHRRQNDIAFDTAIVLEDNLLHIHTDGSRPTKPFLVVGDDNVPLIDRDDTWSENFNTLLIKGYIEYLDVWEAIRHANIAESIQLLRKQNFEIQRRQRELQVLARLLKNDKLSAEKSQELEQRKSTTQVKLRRLQKKRYTHAEIDPNMSLGISASIIPFIAHNQSPRNNYQASMGKQAIGAANHSNYSLHFPTTGRSLLNATPAIARTQLHEYIGLSHLPAGQNIILAIITDRSNEEDAVVIKKEALERGLFNYCIVHSETAIVHHQVNNNNDELTENLVPRLSPKNRGIDKHKPDSYIQLDERGLIRPGALIRDGDCLVCKECKIRKKFKGPRRGVKQTDSEAEIIDQSVYYHGEDGIVDAVRVTISQRGETVIDVRIRVAGRPIIGDKVATRAAQKSTIGRILSEVDMPFTKDGLIPDIIINPHALPKRMTVATFWELVTATYGALNGTQIDATSFRETDYQVYSELLQEQFGYDSSGEQPVYSFSSGSLESTSVAIGLQYYQLLKHQTLRKVQVRGVGARTRINRQAPRGRKCGGGVRLSEQDYFGLISHGSAHMLQDRTKTVCDIHMAVYCATPGCGTLPSHNPTRGRIKPCRICGQKNYVICNQTYMPILLSRYLALNGVHMKPQFKRLSLKSDIDDEDDSEDDDSDDEVELFGMEDDEEEEDEDEVMDFDY